jgi:hypothetical protein
MIVNKVVAKGPNSIVMITAVSHNADNARVIYSMAVACLLRILTSGPPCQHIQFRRTGCSMMANESLFTGWVSFLAGILVLVSLFTSWYRKRDPLVSSMIADYSCR